MIHKFPIKYYDNNIVFGEDSVWAYYAIETFNYEFLDEEKKIAKLQAFESLLWELDSDLHVLAIPEYQDIGKTIVEFQKTISGPLKEVAAEHFNQTKEVLQKKYKNSIKYKFYLGVSLNKNNRETIFQTIKSAFLYFKDDLYNLSNMGFIVNESDLKEYREIEESVYSSIGLNISVKRLKKKEVQHLIQRNFRRSMEEEDEEQITPTYETYKNKRIVKSADMLRLSECFIKDDEDLRYLSLNRGEKKSYVSFLPFSTVPFESRFPGNEFIYMLQNVNFPVECSMRLTKILNENASSDISKKKEDMKNEKQYAWKNADDAGMNVLKAEKELYKLEGKLENTQMPLYKANIVLGVAGSTVHELEDRVRTLRSTYRKKKIGLERPRGDQFFLFQEFLPASKVRVKDYTQIMEPAKVASGMVGATKQLGDYTGFFFGVTGIQKNPVYLLPYLAAQGIDGTITNALSASFSGGLGGGKSYAANSLICSSVMAGARGLIVDPKGDRKRWKKQLKYLKGHINLINISNKEENRGLLDPFNILGVKDAQELALSILSYLGGVKNSDTKYFAILSKTIKRISEEENPCMMKILDALLNSKDEKARTLGEHIQGFENIPFAILLFGDGKKRKTINLTDSLNILLIQDLQLPDKETRPEDYKINEILSVAMMMPIVSFATRFIMMDREIFKVVLLDEAWALMGNSQGKALVNKLLRMGRSLNAAINLVTQGIPDLDKDVKNYIGMKFAFRSTEVEEVKEILKFFNLPLTERNIKVIQKLPNCHCLFQDIYGHTGVLKVDVLFKDLHDAFDTRPKMKVG